MLQGESATEERRLREVAERQQEEAEAARRLAQERLGTMSWLYYLAEMRQVQGNEPWISAEELLRTVTVNPARALKKEGLLGKIAPGAHADLIALPFSGALEAVHEEIVNHRKPICWMMVNGQISA